MAAPDWTLYPRVVALAGHFGVYADLVRTFDWDNFFVHSHGDVFFEWLRRELASHADVVLIDSRTGITEMSGVCTHQLADAVVMIVAPNEQNMGGAVRMARSLSAETNPKLITEARNGRETVDAVHP